MCVYICIYIYIYTYIYIYIYIYIHTHLLIAAVFPWSSLRCPDPSRADAVVRMFFSVCLKVRSSSSISTVGSYMKERRSCDLRQKVEVPARKPWWAPA